MHIIYKFKNKLLYFFLICLVFLSFYMIKVNEDITAQLKKSITKQLIIDYEIYKKYDHHYSFSIENRDYIDASDLVDEYKQITPLIIDEKTKLQNKYDCSFIFCDGTQEQTDELNKWLTNLGDDEYTITFSDNNQVMLFGKVEDKGHLLITHNITHLKNIANRLEEVSFEFFMLAGLNLVFVFYLVFLIKNMKQSAINLNKKFEQMHENTKKLAFNDKLTGAATRLKSDVVLDELIDLSNRFEEHKFSVIMIDIDNFKKVNDTLGHDYGDFVLKSVAQVALKNVRQSDTFARWGGEEFVILTPLTHKEEGYIMADKIRQLISELKFEKLDQITCSFGVAEFQKGDDSKRIMKRADELLYLAKQNGKNRVEY